MICFPNIKINLGLRVINRRTDGFHNIESIFYPVNFCDMLEVVEDPNSVRGNVVFTTTGLPISGNLEDNLIYKAYQLVHAEYNMPGVKVHLHKQIPMGAGLGGGSSNAAYMITLLNAKFELGMTIAQMESMAAQLGSDCAFFIQNKPAYLFGKGHELEPFEFDLKVKGFYLVLLYANVHSNTFMAYQQVKRRETIPDGGSLKELVKRPAETWKETVQNDFESSVFAIYPQLETIKQELYASGAVYASMSGSGSSMFGLFKQKPQLREELRPLIVYQDWL
jgi:4-diphosphocytidyl-2-C-methyl-D-erythritol kinase